MDVYNLIGMVSAVVVLVVYGYSVRKEDPMPFHWANTLLWFPIAVPSVVAGVWGASLLSVCFGIIGTIGVISHYHNKALIDS